jgi:hypothetical protein
MNQRQQAFPTLLHCPDSSQHHKPPDKLTDRRRRGNQPQVPLLKQSPHQPALHLTADSPIIVACKDLQLLLLTCLQVGMTLRRLPSMHLLCKLTSSQKVWPTVCSSRV